ncbi:DUF502 domain-containing protein [Halorubrum sp. CBA1125]|uniref:DUF502 domain-containing protein n=1 Tax=Halorubrum sp. CBA1125 TaxID=2668072 RepID=UPI0012E884FA|nr:DUF502 domain-containing protein [Halorubrum sp. CBA1125]MUW15677.1 DUF502 domain-containing protein [Halorubrum sp. CBA1125]
MVDELPWRERLRRAFLTGIAVIVPSVITLAVLAVVFDAIYAYLNAFSSVFVPLSPRVTLPLVGSVETESLVEAATPIVFVGSILLLGFFVDSTRHGERAVDYVDYAIERVPGVGSVYQGFRQMSDAMLESDSGNFREVVLVEFPTEGSYTLAFVTSETPSSVTNRAGDGEMRTLFMPMAPNPVMGGHVVFVPERRILDVDLSVDEGIRALVTSGVALEEAVADVEGVEGDDVRAASPEGQIDSHLPAEDDRASGRGDGGDAKKADDGGDAGEADDGGDAGENRDGDAR